MKHFCRVIRWNNVHVKAVLLLIRIIFCHQVRAGMVVERVVKNGGSSPILLLLLEPEYRVDTLRYHVHRWTLYGRSILVPSLAIKCQVFASIYHGELLGFSGCVIHIVCQLMISFCEKSFRFNHITVFDVIFIDLKCRLRSRKKIIGVGHTNAYRVLPRLYRMFARNFLYVENAIEAISYFCCIFWFLHSIFGAYGNIQEFSGIISLSSTSCARTICIFVSLAPLEGTPKLDKVFVPPPQSEPKRFKTAFGDANDTGLSLIF